MDIINHTSLYNMSQWVYGTDQILSWWAKGGGESRVGDICDYVILKDDSLDSSELLCCEFQD